MTVQPKIGLEIHVSPRTQSKLFCSCATAAAEPNAHTCDVCLGFPGSKPVLNRVALNHAIQIGLALNCDIARRFSFSRKTYFYPDLAKHFQITQFEFPLGVSGRLDYGENRSVRIRRVHLEEDPAALVHESGIGQSAFSLVDYNRSGHPLVEIVTEPDLVSAKDARLFLDELASNLSYLPFFVLGVDALKADANVSINGGERVEIKNITGFRDVERAIESEIDRQSKAAAKGERIEQHTRGFDAVSGKTFLLRTKEGEDDYGYIFEPDLPIVHVDDAWLSELKSTLPVLPAVVRADLVAKGYSPYDAQVIAAQKPLSGLVEALGPSPQAGAALARNLVAVAHYENRPVEDVVQQAQSRLEGIRKLCDWLRLQAISEKSFKDALIASATNTAPPEDPVRFIESRKLLLDPSSSNERAWIEQVFSENPVAVREAQAGNAKSINFLVGQTLRQSKGAGDPRRIADMVQKKLGEKP